jgi:hypothetical protein
MNIQYNDITPATYWYYVRHPVANKLNSTLLTAEKILLYTKKLYLIHDSHSHFHIKRYCHVSAPDDNDEF